MSLAESLPFPIGAQVSAPNIHVVPDTETYESTTGGFMVRPEVMRELNLLRNEGIDAATIDAAPHFELPITIQEEVDRQSTAIGKLPKHEAIDTLFDDRVHSAGAIWSALSKRAIALHALTKAGDPVAHTIAPNIPTSIYEERIIDGKSALELLERDHPKTAGLVRSRYQAITTTPLSDKPYSGNPEDSLYLRFVEENGFTFLNSRDFLTGVIDSRAVDTRAVAATRMALDHVLESPEVFADRPLVTASLACGAAAPMFELDKVFEENGILVGKNILVDNDAMALASAVALGRSSGMSDKVDIHFQDLIKSKLTDYIEPHSVDIIDILGIVDYLPTTVGGYKAATNFIGSIRDIIRPGGIIVAGNALKSRPQQEFFDKVWPHLQQRDPIAMLEIIEAAGYDRKSVQVRVPQREGVYGVYGIKVPTDSAEIFRARRTQIAKLRLLNLIQKFRY